MNRNFIKFTVMTALLTVVSAAQIFAQSTSGGTVITNTGRIGYNEPGGGSVSTQTNPYSVTVSNVAGLSITPDGGSLPQAVVGQTGIIAPFQVCNTGNFTETVTYPAGSSEIILSGASATLTGAVIDVNNSGTIDSGDIDITGGAAVTQSLAPGCQTVLVELTANATGQINVKLGDANGDNVPSDGSAGSITASGGVNGAVEGTGDYGATGGTGIPVVNAAAVLNGPNGNPGAVGPTSNNDDFQEATTTAGLDTAPGTGSTAAASVVFTNTLLNTGGNADTFAITAPTVPSGFNVEASADCSTYTTISGGGSLALPSTAPNAARNYCIRVTAPAGTATVSSYDTVIRATSQTNNAFNDTIDRLWTGFIRAVKTATVNNSTGVGGANDPVPGAVITYSISYTNLSSTLTASQFVITEDGNQAPNNWATYTTQVAGSATDSRGGTITGDSAGSNVLTDSISSLPAGAAGTFSFKRTIK